MSARRSCFVVAAFLAALAAACSASRENRAPIAPAVLAALLPGQANRTLARQLLGAPGESSRTEDYYRYSNSDAVAGQVFFQELRLRYDEYDRLSARVRIEATVGATDPATPAPAALRRLHPGETTEMEARALLGRPSLIWRRWLDERPYNGSLEYLIGDEAPGDSPEFAQSARRPGADRFHLWISFDERGLLLPRALPEP